MTNLVRVHLVDLDADPFVPRNWRVGKHERGGRIEYVAGKISLYLAKEQRNRKAIVGYKLREKLKGKPVYNANLLDELLKNPHLIPKEFERQRVFFWGTEYCGSIAGVYIRYLYRNGDVWNWNYFEIGSFWNHNRPAAVATKR